jgi:hypothetical protein
MAQRGLCRSLTSKWAAVSVAAALSASAGCGSSPQGPHPPMGVDASQPAGVDASQPALCDGSSQLVLRIFYEGQLARERLGSAVRVENGYPSFALDGHCQYYVSGGWTDSERHGRDLAWHHGFLPDDVRNTLERDAALGDLPSFYDCASSGGGFDIPTPVIENARSSVACVGGAGMKLLDFLGRMREIAAALWSAGQPMGEAMRVNVVPIGSTNPDRYVWPGTLNLLEYFEQDIGYAEESAGKSKLVPAADAGPLRALREQYLRDQAGDPTSEAAGILVSDGMTEGTLYMRDALTYEDDRGLLRHPGE